jgi:intergrase/recombinase
MKMNYCRKIFATALRTNGVQQETIDLLQGRLPRTVFPRHYFRPDFEQEMRMVRDTLTKIKVEIA